MKRTLIAILLLIAAPAFGQTPRDALALSLQRLLMSHGYPIRVVAMDDRPAALASFGPTPQKYPALVLLGAIDETTAYAIMRNDAVYATVRKAGFRSIEFQTPSQGIWIFDASGAAKPSCTIDRLLCL